VYWDYDYDSEPEPDFIPKPEDHLSVRKIDHNIILSWSEFKKNGRIDGARWVLNNLKQRECNLDQGRFKRFQYEPCEHRVEQAMDRDGWGFEEMDHHRTAVFDWLGANTRSRWSFSCKIHYHEAMQFWFTFEDPAELLLFKLTWA
jgi:hypothetical protein